MKLRVFFFQLGQKIDGQTFSSLARNLPNSFKVATIAKVLSHCNCKIQVQHSMPPESRYEDGLTRILDTLNNRMKPITSRRPFFLFQSRQNFVKILDCFIVFSLFSQFFPSNKVFCNAFTRREQHPALSTLDT